MGEGFIENLYCRCEYLQIKKWERRPKSLIFVFIVQAHNRIMHRFDLNLTIKWIFFHVNKFLGIWLSHAVIYTHQLRFLSGILQRLSRVCSSIFKIFADKYLISSQRWAVTVCVCVTRERSVLIRSELFLKSSPPVKIFSFPLRSIGFPTELRFWSRAHKILCELGGNKGQDRDTLQGDG